MKSAVTFLIGFAFVLQSYASEKVQIQSMATVAQKVAQLQKQFPPEEILVVFDIDNTLLTTTTDLGGDAWFLWQEEKLKNNDTQDLVAPNFAGLLEIQGYLYSLGQMVPPEQGTPKLMRFLQDVGHPVFMLTSRGAEFTSFTQRELTRNGYAAELTAPGPRGGFAGKFIPYDINRPEQACLTAQEIKDWGLKAALPSSYNDGVFYTSGQHKGAMLRSLLCRVHKNYAAIVFVDDSEKHVDRVLKAYENSGVEVQSLRYGAVDGQVARFKASDKAHVIAGWNKVKDVLESVFGKKF